MVAGGHILLQEMHRTSLNYLVLVSQLMGTLSRRHNQIDTTIEQP